MGCTLSSLLRRHHAQWCCGMQHAALLLVSQPRCHKSRHPTQPIASLTPPPTATPPIRSRRGIPAQVALQWTLTAHLATAMGLALSGRATSTATEPAAAAGGRIVGHPAGRPVAGGAAAGGLTTTHAAGGAAAGGRITAGVVAAVGAAWIWAGNGHPGRVPHPPMTPIEALPNCCQAC